MTTKTTSAAKAELQSSDVELPLDRIIPDPNNRDVAAEAAAGDEEWQQFVDSIRVQGVKQRLEVCDRGDGSYDLIEGERRWRAAGVVGLASVPVRIWPTGTRRSDLIELGLLINVQRRAHGALEIGRRLRELKNQYGMRIPEFAARLGLTVDKVDQYLTLFDASDELLAYFQEHAIPLRVGTELVRFQKKHGEAATRRLLASDEALTVAFVVSERKRLDGASKAGPKRPATTAAKPSPVVRAVAAAVARDSAGVAAEVQALLAPAGYLVVACQGAAGLEAELEAFLRSRGAQLVPAAALVGEVPTRA